MVSAITQKKLANASVSVREKAEDAIVRLRNAQDREIGRIIQKDAESVRFGDMQYAPNTVADF